MGDWKSFQEELARDSDPLRAHGWGYSTDVAINTVEDIRRKMDIQPRHRVLEVGCGCGWVLERILHPDQPGMGVDMCEPLARRAPERGVNNGRLRVFVANALDLPFADNSFDRILCYSVFHYFTDDQLARQALQELSRVCAPGGLVLVGDVAGYVERLQARWRHCGISVETVRAVLALPVFAPVRWALYPFRAARHAIRSLRGKQDDRGDHNGLDYRWYSHSFFERSVQKLGCTPEILRQEIPDRMLSEYRFDVMIRKSEVPTESRRSLKAAMSVSPILASIHPEMLIALGL